MASRPLTWAALAALLAAMLLQPAQVRSKGWLVGLSFKRSPGAKDSPELAC